MRIGFWLAALIAGFLVWALDARAQDVSDHRHQAPAEVTEGCADTADTDAP